MEEELEVCKYSRIRLGKVVERLKPADPTQWDAGPCGHAREQKGAEFHATSGHKH